MCYINNSFVHNLLHIRDSISTWHHHLANVTFIIEMSNNWCMYQKADLSPAIKFNKNMRIPTL